jgi:hypothetical protein
MRPRLAVLANLAGDFALVVRSHAGRLLGRRWPGQATSTERQSADEVKRRLDATRERLKRETPPN